MTKKSDLRGRISRIIKFIGWQRPEVRPGNGVGEFSPRDIERCFLSRDLWDVSEEELPLFLDEINLAAESGIVEDLPWRRSIIEYLLPRIVCSLYNDIRDYAASTGGSLILTTFARYDVLDSAQCFDRRRLFELLCAYSFRIQREVESMGLFYPWEVDLWTYALLTDMFREELRRMLYSELPQYAGRRREFWGAMTAGKPETFGRLFLSSNRIGGGFVSYPIRWKPGNLRAFVNNIREAESAYWTEQDVVRRCRIATNENHLTSELDLCGRERLVAGILDFTADTKPLQEILSDPANGLLFVPAHALESRT